MVTASMQLKVVRSNGKEAIFFVLSDPLPLYPADETLFFQPSFTSLACSSRTDWDLTFTYLFIQLKMPFFTHRFGSIDEDRPFPSGGSSTPKLLLQYIWNKLTSVCYLAY